MISKSNPIRSRPMLNMARNQPCIRCGRDGETRPAHYCGFRQHMLGKGRGIKCDDTATADFCHDCDELFSESNYHRWPGGSKSVERSEEFLFWCLMTINRRFENSI